jgi:hypothetical protein
MLLHSSVTLFFQSSEKEAATGVLNLEDEQLGVESEDSEEEVVYGIDEVKVRKVESPDEVVDDVACYAYKSALLDLAALIPPSCCGVGSCDLPVQPRTSKVGTAMLIKWVSNA